VNVDFSDADHGFFCGARRSYHPGAAHDAWASTFSFLTDCLEPAHTSSGSKKVKKGLTTSKKSNRLTVLVASGN
jgi:hypothetical protein